ncbi:MAG: DNA-3-methyladenine glycosylase [Bacillota bacterium]
MIKKEKYLQKLLPQKFYQRDTVTVAKELLGQLLFHFDGINLTLGRIVETEAYLGEGDAASHSFRGVTPRCRTMFARAGKAYIYQIYGVHHCFNITTELPEIGSAVLIRALEPLEGVELMQRRRGRYNLRDLCSGPAKLVQALGIKKEHDGLSLAEGVIGVSRHGLSVGEVIYTTTRVGITKAADLPLRFYIKDNQYVSKK